ncbi:MAG: YraN family protein [Magnetococcales bacterium]|nr:YraN family protein [Magnetococcales bacterium]
MTSWRHWLGRQGESLAAEHLKKHAYEILEKNYAIRQGEIDIIARKNDNLIFCEVRTRSLRPTVAMDTIAESVHGVKQNRLILAAESYLQKHPELVGCCCRFDVILVARRTRNWQLEWIEDAFRPGW